MLKEKLFTFDLDRIAVDNSILQVSLNVNQNIFVFPSDLAIAFVAQVSICYREMTLIVGHFIEGECVHFLGADIVVYSELGLTIVEYY